MAVVFAVTILFTRLASSVIISGIDGLFIYRTKDVFGRIHETKVDMGLAKISYKYGSIGRNTKGWKLKLYTNYFTNLITLKEGYSNGFSEEQMDKMVELINKYRGTPDDEIIKQ